MDDFGLFDLSILENADDDDILNLRLSEAGQEFVDRCASYHPEEHFDSDNSGNHNIGVPGGDKENPSAKPYDGEYGPKPNGLTEKPSARPYDGEYGPSFSAGATLDADTYNNALNQLKKSFKECYDFLDTLSNVKVAEESDDQRQERFVEDAMLKAYEDGPYFEKVDRDDKDEVKEITRKVRYDVEKALKSEGYKFRNIKGILKVVGGSSNDGPVWWRTRLWQVIGLTYVEPNNAKELCDNLTEKLKDKLKGYKILPVRVDKSLIDFFKNNFDYKSNRDAYLLLVDHTVPKMK